MSEGREPSPRPRVAVTLEQCWHRVPGGTAIAALAMVDSLATRGRVDLVGVSARHRHPPVEAFRPSIPVHQLPFSRQALYLSWHHARRPRVERATGRVDIIHATGVAVPPRTAPLVVTVHDLAFLHHPDHPTRWGRHFFRRTTELARRHADLVLCPSQATADDCAAAGFDETRLRVIPWGVDHTPATIDEVASVRARYDLPDRFVLFTGTIEPRKNLPTLVDAYRLLDHDVPLVIAGPGGWGDDLAPRLAGLGDRVRRLGFVRPAHMGPLYAAATVFCYPSLLEGFGLPVLEAMTQSTPVVTSTGTSTAEVAGDAALLVDPRDTAGLAAAIGHILDDEGAAARLAASGVARARSFTWERTAELTESAYCELAP